MHQQLKTIKIPDEWILSGGKDVTVAVIDSYINLFNDNNLNIIKKYFLTNCGVHDGLHCLSVCEIIHNIAPHCKIIVSQALNGKTGDYSGLIRAIDSVKDDDIDVVNFSLSTSSDRVDIKKRIDELSKKSIIIASMANNGDVSYPAMYDNVLSVSSFKRTNINADIYCSDSFSFGNNNIRKTGNSMSTAFVSGIFALAKSYNKDFTKEDIVKQLLGK